MIRIIKPHDIILITASDRFYRHFTVWNVRVTGGIWPRRSCRDHWHMRHFWRRPSYRAEFINAHVHNLFVFDCYILLQSQKLIALVRKMLWVKSCTWHSVVFYYSYNFEGLGHQFWAEKGPILIEKYMGAVLQGLMCTTNRLTSLILLLLLIVIKAFKLQMEGVMIYCFTFCGFGHF